MGTEVPRFVGDERRGKTEDSNPLPVGEKHDLKMRPIYHWTPDRIKAHCAICFLSFSLKRHLEYRVSIQQKPISFSRIQDALIKTQASIVRDITTNHIYRIPSKLCNDAKMIYSSMGIKRSYTPSAIR